MPQSVYAMELQIFLQFVADTWILRQTTILIVFGMTILRRTTTSKVHSAEHVERLESAAVSLSRPFSSQWPRLMRVSCFVIVLFIYMYM